MQKERRNGSSGSVAIQTLCISLEPGQFPVLNILSVKVTIGKAHSIDPGSAVADKLTIGSVDEPGQAL